MKFKDIIFKNIKGNIRKYFLYFNSALFCVFMFVMYMSLVLNDSFGGFDVNNDDMPLGLLFIVSLVAILIFSIFFVSYANYSFMKCRGKELGTYLILGVDNKKVSFMLLVEMSLINSLAIIGGICVGGLFSKLFQMIVLKILDIDSFDSSVKPMGLLISCVVFLILLFSISIISIIFFNKKSIEDLMKDNKKNDIKKYSYIDTIMLVIGLVLIIISFVLLPFSSNSSINSKPLFMISFLGSSIVGTIFLSYFGIKAIISVLKKSGLFYKKMIPISRLDYKHKSNSKLILILSILAAMIVLFVGSPFSLLNLTDTIVESGSSDIEYSQFSECLDDKERIDEIVNNICIRKESVSFNYIYYKNNKVVVISDDDYNKQFDSNIDVKAGHIYIGITTWIPGGLGFNVNSMIQPSDQNNLLLKIDKTEKMLFYSNSLSPSNYFFIIDDNDYKSITDKYIVTMSKVSITDWRESYKSISELRKLVKNGSLVTRIETYRSLKRGYSTFLFVASSLAFMFFISTGCVIYSKMFNELEDEKKSFYKLYRIGITEKEVKKIISFELSFIYFTPLVFGGILGLLIMCYMTNLFTFGTDDSFLKTFLIRGFLAWLIYLLFQFVFYLLTKTKYKNEIINNM